jgi:hypothetical protein
LLAISLFPYNVIITSYAVFFWCFFIRSKRFFFIFFFFSQISWMVLQVSNPSVLNYFWKALKKALGPAHVKIFPFSQFAGQWTQIWRIWRPPSVALDSLSRFRGFFEVARNCALYFSTKWKSSASRSSPGSKNRARI